MAFAELVIDEVEWVNRRFRCDFDPHPGGNSWRVARWVYLGIGHTNSGPAPRRLDRHHQDCVPDGEAAV